MLASNLADLRHASVATIRAGQSPSGGYVACPTFASYRFSWLRDGSFIADAMSRVGEVGSAERFFDWVAGIVERGLGFDARYTLDGERDSSDWPHRQHDGWGLWLWALREHARRHGGGDRWREAAGATTAHLERVREEPCFDWWEEREGIHAATLACIAAGLGDDLDLTSAEDRLDGSLLVLPFLGFGPVDVTPLVSPGGGVHRHLEDVYYGGGEWLLLTACSGSRSRNRARSGWSGSRRTQSPTGLCPSSRRTTCSTPTSSTSGWPGGAIRPRRCSGRTRCS